MLTLTKLDLVFPTAPQPLSSASVPSFQHAAVSEVHEQSPQQSWARGRQAASSSQGGAWAKMLLWADD